MARNPAGKWVARAGATGGSRTYRGQTPVNWYAALTLILVLGVLSVVFANYEYRHPGTTPTTKTQPRAGTTWYAGIAFNICGKVQPPLASNGASTSSSKPFFTTGTGLITIAPKTSSQAGKNATLAKFVSGYQGFTLTDTSLHLPPSSADKGGSKVYKNGEKCPKGTPDHGKFSEVQVTYWTSAFNSKAKATSAADPPTLRFLKDDQLITVGFVPPGTKLARPSGSVVTALIQKSETPTTTTSTPTVSSTPTTAPSTSTTAAPTATTTPSATTAPSTSTTAAPTTTTAAKK